MRHSFALWCSLVVVGCSQTGTPTPSPPTVDIIDVLDAGDVSAEVTDAWIQFQATLTLRLKGPRAVDVRIPAGTLLRPDNRTVQSLIVVEDRTVRLDRQTPKKSIELQVCCTASGKTAPARFSPPRFTLVRLPVRNEVRTLAENLARTELLPDQKYRAIYDLVEEIRKHPDRHGSILD